MREESMTNFSKRIIRSNRREFIGGSAAAVLLASGLAARAQGAKTIKIGFISPVSGPLAAFGQGDAFVLKQVRAMLSKGYKIGESTYAIEILDRDTQSDPSRAAQLAKELITSASVDLILASSTPETSIQ
jgi:branched-chain amino acid transport system substrate-binding protein